ncbi:MAG: hypothetical protein H6831_00915 [Planctomycetes bacterium]|nr:hypothetical protein [Planctomycetota bacterium]MCB9902945.1 hypothetical protein [Planctomycetota bacterium]
MDIKAPELLRGPSAREYLKITWDYPVYVPPQEKTDEGRTTAKVARRALSREEAIKVIAGNDPRPLLVLRECKVCNGTDEALLKGGVDNEKTFLMAGWFHCVKLPVDVLEKDHPFHALFVQGESPEHLFVCSIDGTNHDPLESQTSRTELWKSMRDLLAKEYKKNPDTALKTIARLMDKLDVADERYVELVDRQNEILEEEGPTSRKLPKVAKKLAKAEKERDDIKAEIKKAYEIELKRQPQDDPSATAETAPAEAGATSG